MFTLSFQLGTLGNREKTYRESWYVSFPELRQQQTANYGYVPNSLQPNVFMAVAADLPDSTGKDPLHSRFKSNIASRLVSGALSIGYNEKSYWSGPLISRVSTKLIKPRLWNIYVFFRNETIARSGLELRTNKGIEVRII